MVFNRDQNGTIGWFAPLRTCVGVAHWSVRQLRMPHRMGGHVIEYVVGRSRRREHRQTCRRDACTTAWRDTHDAYDGVSGSASR
ncbi:hypothetical protein EAH75_02200 [Rhodanobacter glycinis]|uniref:Uncharacterized protein n=1 Tax=Rhodanobacter glycinis TaxID=582702 RepID=A0A502BUL8_9GAMM|nr:hypothetical protein EAH88_16420 [Rhodanobacter glycinis]TPG50317.1 hypothetical protein EAH75_02200 [Rhodanobacter glycinis]